MKLKTIALATAFALSSTFALAQTGGSPGGSSAGTSTGTTTGSSTSGAANQGTGANAIESNKMEPGSSQSSNNSATGSPSDRANNQNMPDGKKH